MGKGSKGVKECKEALEHAILDYNIYPVICSTSKDILSGL